MGLLGVRTFCVPLGVWSDKRYRTKPRFSIQGKQFVCHAENKPGHHRESKLVEQGKFLY